MYIANTTTHLKDHSSTKKIQKKIHKKDIFLGLSETVCISAPLVHISRHKNTFLRNFILIFLWEKKWKKNKKKYDFVSSLLVFRNLNFKSNQKIFFCSFFVASIARGIIRWVCGRVEAPKSPPHPARRPVCNYYQQTVGICDFICNRPIDSEFRIHNSDFLFSLSHCTCVFSIELILIPFAIPYRFLIQPDINILYIFYSIFLLQKYDAIDRLKLAF